MTRIANEAANALKALENELPVAYTKPTNANVLVDIAKRLQRLQTKAKRQRRELEATLTDIKKAKVELKAIARAMAKGDA
jgi:hypothetical protein